MPKYALLLDGGFVLKRLRARHKRPVEVTDVVAECDRIGRLPPLEGHSLLRIYFYDAPPAAGQLVNPIDGHLLNLGRTEVHARCKALHASLSLTPNFALRLGEVDVRGYRMRSQAIKSVVEGKRAVAPEDLEPDIEQKGVDLRIGLDIARLSLRQLVDAIVVVTGDSDLIPAFKFARREGIRVYLDPMRSEGVKRELKVHADLVL